MNWDSSERRKFVRAKFPCEITLPQSGDRLISTHVENISAGGIRIIIDQKLEVSSPVVIDIYGVRENPITCQGKVIWSFTRENPHQKDIALFDIGIEFSQIADEDLSEIKRVIASIASGQKEF